MGPVLQRTAMAQSRDDGVHTPPEARRYKTFVMRAVGGALENGEVTLTLVVGARTGLVSEEGLSEPQEIDVPVDAEP